MAFSRFRRLFAFLAVVSLAAALPAPLFAADTVAEKNVESRLTDDIRFLASDELEGRGVGTPGIDKAAEFIRGEFQRIGIVANGKGPFQQFTMISGSELGTPNTLEFLGPEGVTVALKEQQDFQTCSFGGSGAFAAELVFCGYGIDSSANKFREFEEVDLKGKVAIIMRRVPQQGNPHGPFNSAHGDVTRDGDLRTKVSNAVSRGAAAILFVNDPYSLRKESEDGRTYVAKLRDAVVAAAEEWSKVDHSDKERAAAAQKKLSEAVERMQNAKTDSVKPIEDKLMEFGYGGSGKESAVPIAHISMAACNKLLEAALHKNLTNLEAEIDHGLKPQSTVLAGWKARGATTVKILRSDVKNVIGVLEGSGPLADETLVIGAHYDHLGLGGEGSLAPGVKEIHNGADDNASGTVALLELARRLATRAEKEKFQRRIVFMAFTGEEKGLVGSAHYMKEPLFPLDKTIAMFNLDMVGRLKDDKLTVFGTGTSSRWKELVEAQAKAHQFQLAAKPEGFGPSDHSSFYSQKIPVLFFFTGTHSDYHRPTDDWEKINVPGMTRVIDMVEEIVVATANRPERPDYVEVKQEASPERGGSRPYFGSIPDFSNETKGYAISGVSPGSPADQGRLKGGDVIIEFGGRKITGLDDFDLALRNFGAGDEVPLVVQRGAEKVNLKVILGKPR